MRSEIRITKASKGPFLQRDVTEECCYFCAYFRGPDMPYIGFCKRHAPSLGRNGSDDPLWPTVTHENWCGDFARGIGKGGGK